MKRFIRPHRLDAGMHRWIRNTATKNLWRMPPYYDVDDLIQEGYLAYAKCALKYPHVKEVRHFMALVKVSFVNQIHSLANRHTKRLAVNICDELLADTASIPEHVTFHVLVKQLPNELQELITILLNDARPMLRFTDGTRETTNEYFCRLIGIPPEVNVLAVFKEHFGLN